MTRYVAYCRVSTAKQGRSGLGLEAQQAAISAFLKPGDEILAPTFVEIESGKRDSRPELAKAINRAKLTGSTLLVAKLDRLTRNAKFLLTILDSGVDVVFVDLPQIAGAQGRFMLTSMAAVAELEAGLCSERTKASLRAAKECGKVLGGYRGVKVDNALGRAANAAKAQVFAASIVEVITEIRAAGFTSFAAITGELNAKGIKARRGGAWTATQVARVMTLR
jgi:DNA invertase Pin-like site-specific DNA recombinase